MRRLRGCAVVVLCSCVAGSAFADVIQLETVEPPHSIFKPAEVKGEERTQEPDDKSEVSAIVSIGPTRALIVDDKSNGIIALDTTMHAELGPPLTAESFPEKPKWEALAVDDRGFIYVIGSHNAAKEDKDRPKKLAARSLLVRFRLSGGDSPSVPYVLQDVRRFDLTKALAGMRLSDKELYKEDGSGAVKIEGLAVRRIGSGAQARRQLVIGLREPDDVVTALVADLPDDPPSALTATAPIPLELKKLFSFDAGRRSGVRSKLSSIEYCPEWDGFFVLTSTEEPDGVFHGSTLWFVADGDVTPNKPVTAERVWVFGLKPPTLTVPWQKKDGSPADAALKAEGLTVVRADARGVEPQRAQLVIVYDNDRGDTGKPSLIQAVTLARWAD